MLPAPEAVPDRDTRVQLKIKLKAWLTIKQMAATARREPKEHAAWLLEQMAAEQEAVAA